MKILILQGYVWKDFHFILITSKIVFFQWQTVKLYERCLIPCASYPEFWIRYVEFVDARGGREIANYTLGRALSFFLKVQVQPSLRSFEPSFEPRL